MKEMKKKYKLDIAICNGITKDDFCLTKQKAEVKKQDFLDGLRFKVGRFGCF